MNVFTKTIKKESPFMSYIIEKLSKVLLESALGSLCLVMSFGTQASAGGGGSGAPNVPTKPFKHDLKCAFDHSNIQDGTEVDWYASRGLFVVRTQPAIILNMAASAMWPSQAQITGYITPQLAGNPRSTLGYFLPWAFVLSAVDGGTHFRGLMTIKHFISPVSFISGELDCRPVN